MKSSPSCLGTVEMNFQFVETAPVVVKEDMGKAEAEELKGALEKVFSFLIFGLHTVIYEFQVGATIEIL